MIYHITIIFLISVSTFANGAKNSAPLTHLRHREIDPFSTGLMQEDGFKSAAAPECKGQLGWVYRNGFCYMFTSYHETFLKAEEECNKVGGYLADVLDNDENNWIKSVLNVINPKDGTDYWLGGLDANRDGDKQGHNMYWMTGNPMTFQNFVKDQPDGNPYAHMDFDQGFAWNAKDDANDKDNGFICKRPLQN